MAAQVPFLDLPRLHHSLRNELDQALAEVVTTGQFVGGPILEKFESEWASYCGTKYAVGVSDGTTAIELTLRAFGIGPGDEVIVPAMTFIATWEAVAAAGAIPVPVDVDPATLLLDPEAVAAAHTSRTAAIVVVHLYGQPTNMDAIRTTASRLGIAVIEDAAQAHGAEWNGKRAGSLGHAGCFSFYPGKNLGAFGDAGAVVTNDKHVADMVRSLSNHGRRANANRHQTVGGTRRMDTLHASVLSVKLKHLDSWNQARRRISDQYKAGLRDLPVMTLQEADGAKSALHLMVIELDHRDMVRTQLNKHGVSTGVHYPTPCHRQPAFSEFASRRLPVAERASHKVLSLPIDPLLSDADVQHVIVSLGKAIQHVALERKKRARVLFSGPDQDVATKAYH